MVRKAFISLLGLSLILAGCGGPPAMTLRIPREGIDLRVHPDTAGETLALRTSGGTVTRLDAARGDPVVPVAPGDAIVLVDGARSRAILRFEEGSGPIPVPADLRRGALGDRGGFVLEAAGTPLVARPEGKPDGAIEAVEVAAVGPFGLFYLPGAVEGRYEKFAAAGMMAAAGMVNLENGHEWIYGGLLIAGTIGTIALATWYFGDVKSSHTWAGRHGRALWQDSSGASIWQFWR